MSELALSENPPRSRLWSAKAKAAGIHITISGAIFVALAWLILTRWYPPPFFETDGGWQGLRLVFAVDMVLGPLLTLVVFNPAKPRREIVMDLTAIAVFQSLALGWGVWAVHQQRPFAAVEWEGRFYSVERSELAAHQADLDAVRALSPANPPLIHVREPATSEEILEWVRSGSSIPPPPFLYASIKDHTGAAFSRRLDPARLAADAEIGPALTALEQELGRKREELAFMPFEGRYGEAVLVFSLEGELLGHLPAPRKAKP